MNKSITTHSRATKFNKLTEYVTSNHLSNDSRNNHFFKIAQTYVKPQEKLEGIAIGGGESLVLYIKALKNDELIVRKIWSSDMQSVNWIQTSNIMMTPPIKKGLLQVDYLRGLPRQVKPYFPQVYKVTKEIDDNGVLNKVICDESYISGIEVSKFILQYQPNPPLVAKLYTEIFRCLKQVVHKHKKRKVTSRTLESSYFKKIEDRLNTTQNVIPEVITFLTRSSSLYINHEKYINIPRLINKLRNHPNINILEPKYHNLVTGDTNTQNIIINNLDPLLHAISNGRHDFCYSDLNLKFIDPRSLGFNSQGRTTTDDFMYDNKPFHNSFGNYDMIYGKHFILNISNKDLVPSIDIVEDNNPYSYSYKGLEHYFKDIMEEGWNVNNSDFLKEDPYWLIRFVFIIGTHFAAMTTFQVERDRMGTVKDDIETQKKVVAIYCEGVKWLNLAYQMLNKEIKEFHGIQLSKINKKFIF